jgi:hypothetical protein
MIERFPIHDLRAHLETERLKAVEELAEKGGTLPADSLQKIAIMQIVLRCPRRTRPMRLRLRRLRSPLK